MLRIGLIARADSRGLAIQTFEFFRHMAPVKVLGADPGPLSPYPSDWSRYPGAWIRPIPEPLPEAEAKAWLAGLDVVFCAETPYWYEIYDWARELGVKTVCQINPEFWRYHKDLWLPKPDLFVAPSSWRLEYLPDVRELPFPVARDRLPPRPVRQARTFLHVVGHPAISDRAGTQYVTHALRFVQSEIRVVVRAQQLPRTLRHVVVPRNVIFEVAEANLANYWDVYEGADVLLAPRRYGGLSLPVREAASLGMPVIALNRRPENQWLPTESLVPAISAGYLRTQAGQVRREGCSPKALAARIDRLAASPELVGKLSAASDAFAESVSWTRLKPLYEEALASW